MALFSWRKTKKKSDDDEMSFLDHLEALRWHIMRSVLAIIIFAVVLFSYRVEVIGGVFMSPFDKDFVTYRILCENFGQLCNNDIRVQEVEVESPDSLTLEGYLWLGDESTGQKESSESTPSDQDSPLESPVEEEADLPPLPADSLENDSTSANDSIPNPSLDTTTIDSPLPAIVPTDTVNEFSSPRQRVRMKVSVEQFLSNGKINGMSVQTDQGSFVKFQATSPYEQFMKALLYAFFGGLILAFPYVIWEVWRFIQPALSKKERGLIRWNVFFSSLLFFTGILFGYFVILPFSITFLSSFILFDEAENIWRIGDVVNFVLLLLFGSGFLFQLPVGIYYASKIGFVTPKFLRKYRKHAVVGLLVIAAIITPPDPASQVLIFIPLLGLYEVGILISARVWRRKRKRDEAEKAKDEAWRKKKEEEYKRKVKEQEAAAAKEQPASTEQSGSDAQPVNPDPQRADQNAESENDKSAGDEEDEDDDDDDDFDLSPPEGSLSRDD